MRISNIEEQIHNICPYYGEPNGCNKAEDDCDVCNVMDEIREVDGL